MRKIFINEFGRLRSGWRLVIFILAFLAVSLVLATVLRVGFVIVLSAVPQLPYSSFIADVIYRIACWSRRLSPVICARGFWKDCRGKSLGLTFHRGWFRDLVIGSAIGFAALAVAVAIATAGNGVSLFLKRCRYRIDGRVNAWLICDVLRGRTRRRSDVQRLCSANVDARSARLARCALDVRSVWFCSSVESERGARSYICQHCAGRNLVCGRIPADTESLVAMGIHWAWNWALGWFFGLPVSGTKPRFKSVSESH